MSIKAESEESAHTRVLKLEKENKHLQALINTYKDSIKSSELTQVRYKILRFFLMLGFSLPLLHWSKVHQIRVQCLFILHSVLAKFAQKLCLF